MICITFILGCKHACYIQVHALKTPKYVLHNYVYSTYTYTLSTCPQPQTSACTLCTYMYIIDHVNMCVTYTMSKFTGKIHGLLSLDCSSKITRRTLKCSRHLHICYSWGLTEYLRTTRAGSTYIHYSAYITVCTCNQCIHLKAVEIG